MKPICLARSTVFALLTATAAATAGLAEPATQAFLPDTTLLLRVGDRVVTASDFVNAYYGAWPEYRPQADSAGRVQFLKQILNKEVLATVALRSNPTPGFEDRLVLRQHAQRMLSNILFQRLAVDSVRVTDADVRALRREYSFEKRLQHILLADLATALRVRRDLIEKRITWEDAQRRYSIAKHDVGPAGDLGWTPRTKFGPVDASEVLDLEAGQVSEPYRDSEGIHLVRVVGRRPANPPEFTKYDKILREEARTAALGRRMDDIQRELGMKVGLTFDEANVAWAADKFPPTPGGAGVMRIGVGKLPHFAPADTGRVLARWRGGQLSLRGFMADYEATHAYLRTPVNTPASLRTNVETIALQPYRAQLALEKGLDRDPLAVKMSEHKREELLVEHLYHDSIETRVQVTAAELRKYYQAHIASYLTYPVVRFAAFNRATKEQADSLTARLRGGEKAEDALARDSIRFGRSVGFMSKYTTENEGQPFYKMLMEDLKPGQVGVEPSEDRGLWVVQSLSFDGGRQLSFEEAQVYVAESLANQAAEKLLDRFLARHKRGLRIEEHPELVMRVDMRDPADPKE